jgi:GxxExxY protein
LLASALIRCLEVEASLLAWNMAGELPDPAFPEEAFPLQALTGTIIAGAFSVFRTFGYGFLEPVYRRALGVDLQRRGVRVEQEVKYELFHFGEQVGFYRADMVVDSRVIVEAKTGLTFDPLAAVQLLNYLCAARLSLGLVIHFGPKAARVKRVIRDENSKSIARDTNLQHIQPSSKDCPSPNDCCHHDLLPPGRV